MIKRDNFKILSEEEKSQYKFGFCANCAFYECELVREYVHFNENHFKISIPEVSAKPVSTPVKPFGHISVTAVSSEDGDLDEHSAAKMVKVEAYKEAHVSSVKADNFYVGPVSYDQEELKKGCIMSYRHITQVECGRDNVTNGIGEHYKIETRHDFEIETDTIDRWEPIQPVFISAQTGQGKNYFIENTLIPYVRDLNNRKKTNQRVLILSNRLALKRQIKNRLDGNDDPDNEKGKIYPYKEFANVMTYQSLLDQMKHLEKAQKNGASRYIYVICDEAHFFTSDAMFNPHTQKILSALVRIFKDAIRVYMSATPYECLEYIIKYETEYKDQYEYYSMAFYHFKRDYSYLNTNSYSSIKELYNKIVTSIDEHGEKWLIFIDDIEKCKAVKEELEEYGRQKGIPMVDEDEELKISKIFAVDATSKKDKDYESMVLNERLNKSTYVLITTSVLDNGVNLTGIDNIVVSEMSKVKCLQMVGRARVKGHDQKTLYIRRFDDKYVNNRIFDFEKQRDAYHQYEMAYDGPDNVDYRRGDSEYSFLNKYYNGDEKDWQNAKHWFGRPLKEPTKLYLNEIAHSQLERLIPQYQSILDEIRDERELQEATNPGNKHIVGQKYLEHQLSWFGKKYYADNDITLADFLKAEKELREFLESHVGKRMYSDKENKNKEQIEFRKTFTKLHDRAFGRADKNKTRDYGISTINKIFENHSMNYRVESLREKKKGYWVVIKLNQETTTEKIAKPEQEQNNTVSLPINAKEQGLKLNKLKAHSDRYKFKKTKKGATH